MDTINLLIKFGEKQNIESLQNGKLYMKNLKYYINREIESGDNTVGDKYDGMFPINDCDFDFYDSETKKKAFSVNKASAVFDLGYTMCPTFCMFLFDRRNITETNLNSIKYEFTEEQKIKLKGFGTHALVITNTNSFINRVEKGFLNNKMSVYRNTVKYFKGNELEHLKDIQKDNRKIAFWKRDIYTHQQEYRFFGYDCKVDDHCEIDIGDLRDISQMVEIDNLFDMYALCNFK